jgi:hypothetical protein
VNKDSSPITVFLLFFMEVIQLLVTETAKCYSHFSYMLVSDGKCSQLLDVPTGDVSHIFLAIIIQMECDVRDIL